MPKCLTCNDHKEIGCLRPDGYDGDRCPDCNAPQWFVVKSSRAFSGFSYTGPALQYTSFAGRANTVFDSYDEAVKCAQELTEANPVGFDVYHDNGNKVWPVKFKEL